MEMCLLTRVSIRGPDQRVNRLPILSQPAVARVKRARDNGVPLPTVEASMSKSQEWTKLCREHDAAKEEHDKVFSGIVAAFSAQIGGQAPAGPGLEELEYEEKARKQLEEIRARMQTFIGANTWPV